MSRLRTAERETERRRQADEEERDAEDSAAREGERQAERDRELDARAQAILDEEVRSGICQRETMAQLERALAALDQQIKGLQRGREPTFVTIVDHDYVVATPDGNEHAFDLGLGGRYHVIAIAPQPIEIAVVDGKGNPVTNWSLLTQLTQLMGGAADGRVWQARGMEQVSVTAKGRGCSLLALLHE